MNAETRAEMGRRLGTSVVSLQGLGGGDINEAFLVGLADGRRVFAKCNADADRTMFEVEARGLTWLAEAAALRVPEVIAVFSGTESACPFLVLELLEPGARASDFDDLLGEGLAALHRAGAPSFGLAHDNFIGSLPQSNRLAPSWVEFYRERRLAPQLERARRHALLDAALERAAERLLGRLDALLGSSEPPARLHGDLWSGNVHVDSRGQPVLIDPAVYGGHREMDLAMLRLFGGVGERVFEAYQASYPLAPGHRERVPLCQLYPLLVHLNLFGSSYARQVRSVVERYV